MLTLLSLLVALAPVAPDPAASPRALQWSEDEVMRYFDIPAGTNTTVDKDAFSFSCRTPPGNSYDVCSGYLATSDTYVCRGAAAIMLLGAHQHAIGTFTYEIRCDKGYVRGEYSGDSHAGNMNQYVDGASIYSKGIGF